VSLRFGLLRRAQTNTAPVRGGALRPSGVVPLGGRRHGLIIRNADNRSQPAIFLSKIAGVISGCCPVSTRHNSSSETPSGGLHQAGFCVSGLLKMPSDLIRPVPAIGYSGPLSIPVKPQWSALIGRDLSDPCSDAIRAGGASRRSPCMC
jgi:hypothetical protein